MTALIVMVATMGATAARADWHGRGGEHHHGGWGRFEARMGRGWVEPVRVRYGVGYRQPGHYETRSYQVWVPGVPTQVWVDGQCDSWGRCAQGGYQTVMSAGHYETRTQTVWVAGW